MGWNWPCDWIQMRTLEKKKNTHKKGEDTWAVQHHPINAAASFPLPSNKLIQEKSSSVCCLCSVFNEFKKKSAAGNTVWRPCESKDKHNDSFSANKATKKSHYSTHKGETINFIYNAMNGTPPPFFSPPRRCSLNKLCFSVRMTFSPQASEKTSASTADESAVGGGGGEHDLWIHYPDC